MTGLKLPHQYENEESFPKYSYKFAFFWGKSEYVVLICKV